MKKRNSKKMVWLVSLFVIVIASFLFLYFNYDLLSGSSLNNQSSFDIYKEIALLNKDRISKYRIVDSDWLEHKKGGIGSDFQLFNEQNSWDDFKESLKSNPPQHDTLYLDELNRVIWYGILPATYFEY